jgi:hypothetical protein
LTELIELPSIGFFKGFSESGFEFKAEIVSPYHTEFHPLLGSFILVAINKENMILGRITKFFPVGVMASYEGDDYLADLSRIKKDVPESLKESKLRYNVNVKLLGGIVYDHKTKEFRYTPSIRKLPHLGAIVGRPTEIVLNYLCSLGALDTEKKEKKIAVEIGYYTLGEQEFDGVSNQPKLPILFNIDNLVSKRTFVFARAGYGKSNLIKMLLTLLYEKEQDVGVLLFDPEGEYAFPDKWGRPGLADVPELAGKIVVFTDRNDPKLPEKYRRMIAGRVKLNLAEFSANDIIANCVAEGKQESVFASRVRGLHKEKWGELVKLLAENKFSTDDKEIANITEFKNFNESKGDVSVTAIKNNIIPVINSLHDKESQMIEEIRFHLKQGHIVIIDISLLSSSISNDICGLILNELFNKNQENFTIGSSGEIIKIIAIIEEAQTVLAPGMKETSPFVRWAKEGRKYGLGSILVTQQPGAIANELLSQGDNFFAFHLLSENDLRSLQRSNAHFSNDILANILNEPIKGNCYFWSAPDQPFVLPVKIKNVENVIKSKKDDSKKIEKTATEIYHEKFPGLLDDLSKITKNVIECHKDLSLFSNIEIDGKKIENQITFSQFFLSKCVADSVPADLENIFVETKGSNRLIKGKFLDDALTKLKISTTTYLEGSKYSYLLVTKEAISPKKTISTKPKILKSTKKAFT